MTNDLPRDASPPISEEEASSILRQLLSETEMLLEQEKCPEDWLRVQALRLAIQVLTDGNQLSTQSSGDNRGSESAIDVIHTPLPAPPSEEK